MPPPPPPPPQPIDQSPRRVLSDITNISPSRRVTTSIARKERLLRSVSLATTAPEKAALFDKAGIAPHNRSKYLQRYKAAVEANKAADATQKQPLTAKRRSGGGRHAVLTEAQEKELRDWLMQLRRHGARVAVSEVMVRIEARRRFGIPATHKWVRGWMARQGLAMRRRTTYKEITTERMLAIKASYQLKSSVIFNSVQPQYIWNTDETSVFYDAPGSRTIDEKGARDVEIGHTGKYADRVSVVLCCSYNGDLLPPLVVHRCYETKKLTKSNTYRKRYISTPKGGDAVPGVEMWITHKKKAWLDTEMMVRWLEHVYADGVRFLKLKPADTVLFMDGCSAHHTAQAEDTARTLGIRVEVLPPNTTPFLQPCDQYVNALFKSYYHKEWEEWYMEKGYMDKSKPNEKYSNLRRAKEEDVNKWIANATAQLILTPRSVRRSWFDTLIAPIPHMMHLPPKLWHIITSFMQNDVITYDTCRNEHDWTSRDWLSTRARVAEMMQQQARIKFDLPATKRKRKQPPMEVVEQEESNEEVKEEAVVMEEEAKVSVVVRVGRKRYVAIVEHKVVSAIRWKRKCSDGHSIPAQSAVKVEPMVISEADGDVRMQGAGTLINPLRILQPWDS